MRVLHALDDPASFRGGVVSIGNFDGVHRGHQAMLAALVRRAHARGVPAVAFTFDPHPIAILRPDKAPPPLTTTARKVELLAAGGVDCVIVYPTDQSLLALTPDEFFQQIIVGQIGACGLVEGPNFFYGHDRQGNVDTLRASCAATGLEFEVVPPVQVGGRLVSSSVIRQLLLSGEVAAAAELLGYPYEVRGRVTEGARRGRTIGFPTANLAGVETLLPADGVYAARAWALSPSPLAGEGRGGGATPDAAPQSANPHLPSSSRGVKHVYAAAVNLGPNPTFSDQERKLEAHLLDFHGELYGQELVLEFLERLRETRPFAGRDELVAQLQRDVAQTRRIATTL